MEFSIDSHFLIGRRHETEGKPCQDYAATATNATNAYAFLSDGCSTGGETDIGSRLIVRAALKHANELTAYPPDFFDSTSRSLAEMSASLNLSARDCDSTLLAVSVGANIIRACLVGDGVIAMRTTDGSIKIYEYSWNKNLPYYLSYRMNDREKSFIDNHGDRDVEALSLLKYSNDESEPSFDQKMTVTTGINGISLSFATKTIETFAIFSDGISDISGLTTLEATTALFAFKNSTGSFVKRRMMSQVNEWKKTGNIPRDDLSMAAIHINHDSLDIDIKEE